MLMMFEDLHLLKKYYNFLIFIENADLEATPDLERLRLDDGATTLQSPTNSETTEVNQHGRFKLTKRPKLQEYKVVR